MARNHDHSDMLGPRRSPRRAKSSNARASSHGRAVDVPKHIREHLPEEVSDLPADLIYATDFSILVFEKSKELRRATEAHEANVDALMLYIRGGDAWPRWATVEARVTEDAMLRVKQMQKDAIRWVEEQCHPTPTQVSSSSSPDEEAGFEPR